MAKRNTKSVQRFLSKDDLLNQQNLKREIFDIPALKGSVYVRELAGLGLLNYRDRIESFGDGDKEISLEQSLELMSYLVSLTVCDEQGHLLFTEEEAKGMMNGSLNLLKDLSTKAMQVSGMSEAVIKEIQENLKNAEPLPSTAS